MHPFGSKSCETSKVTSVSIVFLVVAIVFSVADWAAVARSSKTVEYVCKPIATLALLATAASLDVVRDGTWGLRLVALAFCVLGDVFLMLPRNLFVPGLASFAVAQILFAAGFLTADVEVTWFVVGVLVAVPVAGLLSRRFVAGIRRSGHADLVVPVIAYVMVISVMAVGAAATGDVVAIAGATLFMVSDSLIAESRFVRKRSWYPVGIMVTYHLALAGLVLSLL